MRAVVTGWSAVSPWGRGAAAFADGLLAARPAREAGGAATVPDFDVRELLGRRDTNSMDRATAYAIVAVGDLLAETAPARGTDLAVVLGTTSGSLQAQYDMAVQSTTRRRRHLVDPGLVPHAVLNSAASRTAIRHHLRGANSTVAAGAVSGLLVLDQARRMLTAGRADAVVAGAAEECSPTRRWLTGRDDLGEGAVALLVERADDVPAGRPVLAEVLGVSSRVVLGDAPGDTAAALRECVAGLLRRTGTAADELWAAVPLDPANHVFAEGVHVVGLTELIGHGGAVSAAFQVAAVLALAGADPASAGRRALVTSADGTGVVAAAVLELPRSA
ncbi:beta-ketoacyl synthase N-terminal-like domain-containing protein [Umezawaea beigongshangensis]|uniref:beta-ketoacyl synthase N-terminal-like domain-containing protein n=1 Tax=Umezawaea beigongshangensis TaxID=2780383 RepID=UPI0018F1ADF8|nr:beta-ketoacyl synthase N-terminal-like domain-containing protein [Umezawaea beigongshangensis]